MDIKTAAVAEQIAKRTGALVHYPKELQGCRKKRAMNQKPAFERKKK